MESGPFVGCDKVLLISRPAGASEVSVNPPGARPGKENKRKDFFMGQPES